MSDQREAVEMAKAVLACGPDRDRHECGDCAEMSGPLARAVIALDEECRRRFDLAAFFDAKAAWSRETFGPGDRYAGVIAHIRKELDEIEAEPSEAVEWIDVVLLAMDGAWRSAGLDGGEFVAVLKAKDGANRMRTWPDWRTLKPGEVSEHVKPAPSSPGASEPSEADGHRCLGFGCTCLDDVEPSEADVEALAFRLFAAYERDAWPAADIEAMWPNDRDPERRYWLAVAREAIRLGADPSKAGQP
jgi:hypothetical protein